MKHSFTIVMVKNELKFSRLSPPIYMERHFQFYKALYVGYSSVTSFEFYNNLGR